MKKKHSILAFCFISIFIFGLTFGFFGFPAFLKSMIKKQVVLTPDSDTRKMWTKVPFAIDFAIYVFNVTNPDEVSQGATPILKEIGPYMFDEWKDKYNLEDNEEDDTITFNMRNTFIFRPDKTIGLNGEEIITIPHPLIQPMSVFIKRERAPMLPLIASGLKEIFQTESPFIKASFMDLFFRGILVDCSSDAFGAKAICLQFHTGDVKGGTPFNSTHFLFSLLAAGNATDAGKFTVYRGKNNSHDVGRVIKFDDDTELSVWDDNEENGQKCNQFKGTDSTIFPPYMNKDEGLWAFTPNLCRSLGSRFDKISSYEGVPTMRYTMDFGDLKNEVENHCFCENPPDKCPLKGTMSLQKCAGAPMIVSLPHFLKSDLSLLKNIIGLSPDEDKHGVFIEFEIMSGTPMSVAKRLQFSFDIESVEEVEPMKNLKTIIMPVFWIEESVNLNKTFVDLLQGTIFLGIKINNVVKWMCIGCGLFGFIISIWTQFDKPKVKQDKTNSVEQLNDERVDSRNGNSRY